MPAGLPARIKELAADLGAGWDGAIGPVRFSQSGRMRADASSPWRPYRARQTTSVETCAFAWRARTGPFGLIEVRDALLGGRGRLSVRALGFIPLAAAAGADVTRGELMRYLAELAWAPDAIVRNRNVTWRLPGTASIAASAGEGDMRCEVVLHLDPKGRIEGVSAADRPRAVRGRFEATPWRGRFFDYTQRQGRWLPARGEAAWIIDGEEVVCWEGTLHSGKAQ